MIVNRISIVYQQLFGEEQKTAKTNKGYKVLSADAESRFAVAISLYYCNMYRRGGHRKPSINKIVVGLGLPTEELYLYLALGLELTPFQKGNDKYIVLK
mgnify:CR=1 FL=1